jgi:predicted transcriptional regulator
MKKESFLTLRIPRELHTKLQKLAQEKDLSVGWIVRNAVQKHLEKEDKRINRQRSKAIAIKK